MMMKTLFYLLLSLALFAGCSKDDHSNDKTSDFNPTFAKILQEKGYISDSKRILYEEVKDIEKLDVRRTYEDWKAGKGLTSLAGIEHFESLTQLDCFYNQLTSLDVSKNTALTELYCGENQLTSLDVSKNTALISLSCGDNQLTSLDVSKNTALIVLDCYFNRLTSLDVCKNIALTYLSCSTNQFTSLDVSRNTALTGLNCRSNQLTSLNISQNTALTKLFCYDNPGDGESLFPVTAWFDNNNIPGNMLFNYSSEGADGKSWTYDGKTIRLDFRKAE